MSIWSVFFLVFDMIMTQNYYLMIEESTINTIPIDRIDVEIKPYMFVEIKLMLYMQAL